jgi:hypothetical protein
MAGRLKSGFLERRQTTSALTILPLLVAVMVVAVGLMVQ